VSMLSCVLHVYFTIMNADNEINILPLPSSFYILQYAVEDTVDWARVKEEDTDDDNEG